MKEWSAAKAKENLSEVIEGAETEPQVIMKHGKPAGVVIGYRSFLENREGIEGGMSRWLSELADIDEGDIDPVVRGDRFLPEGFDA